ncbi:MAG: peptide ABC transporter substrate-binding protein, partial [Dehalococcoidales bacterium]|nr:peptide ABC transporter substrate-binding protein [Dehalococcoidales bacterium]
MKKILNTLILIVIICSLLFTGCQPDNETEISLDGYGNLNLYGIDPWTLDPAISGEMTSHEYIVQLFSGLVYLDSNLEPAPDIAEKWQISDDGRTYTFYLRKNATFHDGREVTAQDFKYSWERACAPEAGSQTAATYLGDIIGVREVLSGKTREISGIKIVNDHVLEITIDAPKSYFLSKLTYPTAFVVDKNNVESGLYWWQKPNGTGPFKLKQWDKNNLFILERNNLYHGTLAKISSVTFQLWGGIPMNLYETDKIDVTSVYIDYIDKVTDEAGSFYNDLQIVPELSFYYIGFNHSQPPFDDINIRQAFSQAIDKEKLASLVFRDMVQAADGILPQGMPGFNEDLSGLEHDIAKAKELIKASKYGDVSNLPPITITTAGWGGLISRDLEAIISEWRQNLGIEVTVRQLEPERFLYNLNEEKDEMFYMAWIADYPHPQDFLEVLFHSSAENNYSEYTNSEADTILKMAGLEQDKELSFELYQQAEQN